MDDWERWGKLRVAVRMRLSEAQAKEEKFKDPGSILTIQYAQLVLKDIIRIMNLLEEK
jgi:hypothetical protein